MTTAKTITLSAETLDECKRAFATRLNQLQHNLDMAREYGSEQPVCIWSDLVRRTESAQAELLSATKSAGDQGKHADWYPLLRRMVLAQIKGDYEAGERFALILQEHGAPNNEAEFDKFMGLAAKAMGARA